MAGLEDVVQKVLLEGDSEVTEALKQIGETGARTFEKLEAAAEHSLGSLTSLSIAIGGITTALGIATTALLEFVSRQDEAVVKVEALAHSFGTTEEGIESLRTAFASVGVTAEVLGRGIQHMSSTIAREWSQIQEQVRKSADEQTSAMLGIESAALGLEKAQSALSDSGTRAAQTAIHDSESQRGSVLALASAEQHLIEVIGGKNAVSAGEKQALESQQAILAVEKSRQAVIDANIRAAEDEAKATLDLKEASLAVQKAALARREAEEKANEVNLRDIPTITKALSEAKAGGQQLGSAIDLTEVSVQNMVKGLINLAAAGGKEAPKGFEVLHQAAALFSGDVNHMISDSQRLAIVQQLFAAGMRQGGASVSQITSLLSQGTGALDAYAKQAEHVGHAFPQNVEAAKEFNNAMASLLNTLEQVKQSLATAASPILAEFLKAIGESITDDNGLLHNFITGVRAIGSAIGTIIGAFQSLSAAVDSALGADKGTAMKALLITILGLVSALLSPWLAIPAAITLVIIAIGELIDNANKIKEAFQRLESSTGWIGTIIRGIEQMIKGFGVLIGLAAKLLGLTDSAKAPDAANNNSNSSTPSSIATSSLGLADGGPVRGPGTGTSDSIPAWLSNGEFVVTANGSNLMDAINHFGARIAGFADGGFVGGAIPLRMAQGGPAKGGSILNLRIGEQQFNGLHAPEPVATKLSQYAVRRQVSSAGRRPSWVK